MPTTPGIELFWSSGNRVEPLSAKDASVHVGELCADLYTEQALAYGIVDKVLKSDEDVPLKPSFLSAL